MRKLRKWFNKMKTRVPFEMFDIGKVLLIESFKQRRIVIYRSFKMCNIWLVYGSVGSEYSVPFKTFFKMTDTKFVNFLKDLCNDMDKRMSKIKRTYKWK